MTASPIRSHGTLVTSDKEQISYCLYCQGHASVIVVVHGFYNSKEAVLLQELAAHLSPFHDVFMFDFRGHGKSSGLFHWMSKEERDLDAALDFVQARYARVAVIAFSLGASICINALSRQRAGIASLVAVSPPSEFRKIDYHVWALSLKDDVAYTLFTRDGRVGKGFRPGPFWLKKKRPIDSVRHLTVPVLYIHGDKDWVVRPWHSQALFEKTRTHKRLVMIEGGPHAEYLLKNHAEQFLSEVNAWLEETFDTTRGTRSGDGNN